MHLCSLSIKFNRITNSCHLFSVLPFQLFHPEKCLQATRRQRKRRITSMRNRRNVITKCLCRHQTRHRQYIIALLDLSVSWINKIDKKNFNISLEKSMRNEIMKGYKKFESHEMTAGYFMKNVTLIILLWLIYEFFMWY